VGLSARESQTPPARKAGLPSPTSWIPTDKGGEAARHPNHTTFTLNKLECFKQAAIVALNTISMG